MNKAYDTLVLSGGGIRGIALLGGLQYLHDVSILQGIRRIIGTSVGSIIGYLLILGYTPIEIMVIVCKHNLLSRLSSIDCVNLLHGHGASTFTLVHEFLEKLTLEKSGRLFTLGELKRTYDKDMICATYNFTSGRAEYLSADELPDLQCLTALRMSSAVPFFFEDFHYGHSRYIDGALADNLALCMVRPDLDTAIALRLVTPMTTRKMTTRMLCTL
jgi:NTE family protein